MISRGGAEGAEERKKKEGFLAQRRKGAEGKEGALGPSGPIILADAAP